MFTGLVQALGTIKCIESITQGCCITLDVGPLITRNIQLGDSIAVNGVCLTVMQMQSSRITVELSSETMRCTTLNRAQAGDTVNLELALTPSSHMGGHFVSGHVDGIGKVIGRRQEGQCIDMAFAIPQALSRYIAPKGSVCIDGVSLTVNTVRDEQFSVMLIPHTLKQTLSGSYQIGSQVNIEVDIIARYLERLLNINPERPGLGINETLLAQCGFLSKSENT